MRWKRSLWSLGVGLSLAGQSLFAADPMGAPEVIPGPRSPGVIVAPQSPWGHAGSPPCAMPPIMPPATGEPPRPGEGVPPGQPNIAPDMGTGPDSFAQAPEAGTAGGAGAFNPTMFGDFISSRYILIPPDPNDFIAGTLSDGDEAVRVLIPQVARGAFKIADNESPRPLDRVYINSNYFSIQGIKAVDTPVTNRINIYREILGGEKTFLDGNASVGIRVPFFQLHTSVAAGQIPGGPATTIADTLNQSAVGDLTFIGKYAFINNRESGNVLSGGLVVTAPTGPRERLGVPGAVDPITGFAAFGTTIQQRTLHPTLLQPYAGGIYNMGRAYVHGFSSILVPTDSRDVTYFFNDIGIGYFLIRSSCDSDRMITALVPTFEVHANDPLNRRGSRNVPIGGVDVVDLTAGVTVGLGRNIWWSTGAVTPVTGPRPFQYELQSFLNFRF